MARQGSWELLAITGGALIDDKSVRSDNGVLQQASLKQKKEGEI